jgi:2-oxoglutarate dehydrogenase E1 component
MLLPHGYEGQGPEHSSARIERFLQQCNDHPEVIPPADKSHAIQQANWQIVMCSTPANYFHALRRQLCREFRKPLIVFNPKSLLRLKEASSTIAEMGPGTSFQKLIPESGDSLVKDAKAVKRIIFCSGKVYYDLAARRAQMKSNNIAIARVEQVSPFPFHEAAKQMAAYPNAEVVWVQEEPMNMGCYNYVKDRFATAAGQINKKENFRIRYIGRNPSASTAAGHLYSHRKELEAFLKEAFTL